MGENNIIEDVVTKIDEETLKITPAPIHQEDIFLKKEDIEQRLQELNELYSIKMESIINPILEEIRKNESLLSNFN